MAVSARALKPHLEAKAALFLIPAREGGRPTPIGVGYRPQFFFGTTAVTGTMVEFAGDTKVVTPGDHVEVLLELGEARGTRAWNALTSSLGRRTRVSSVGGLDWRKYPTHSPPVEMAQTMGAEVLGLIETLEPAGK